ncbi:hypothetical protein CLU79DRAFT_890394 [Phycomyces nitens]|nr:hypothetical protein CLU79DRAFT_890394 [Phycomyces nitens]
MQAPVVTFSSLMSASFLPFEIISIIANFLSLKDKLCCTTVCRTWRIPFQESLWLTIDISGRRKLESICDPISHIYQVSGYRVQTLNLAWRLGVSDEQLYTFQQLFPNLKQLYIRQGSLSKDNFGKTTDWSLWRSLTHLNVSLSWLSLEDEAKELVHILSFTPNLKWLEYSDAAIDQKRLYTWENIDALHLHLPHLSYLSMAVYLDPIPPADLLRVTNVNQAESLTTLKLCVDNMDIWWMYYMARKYLSIQTLELRADSERYRPKDYLETAMPLFSTLTRAFPNLKTAVLTSRPGMELPQTMFWALVNRLCVPLKNLTYEMGFCEDDPNLLRKYVTQSIRSCSNTLETLYISSPVDFSDRLGVVGALETCRFLVNLHIMAYNCSLAFDILLDHCVSIKRLTLNVEILCEVPYTASTESHGLQMLDISRATTCADLFSYISHRCRRLKYMRLADMNVIGQLSNGGRICLDMSPCRFDYLELNRVLFYGSMAKWGPENIINTMVLVQSRENISEQGTSIPGDQTVPYKDSTWLHLNQTPTSFPWMQRWRILKANEIKVARNYFMEFEKNRGSGFSSADIERSDMGQVSWYNWRQDLPRGFAVFCCEIANKYKVNTCRYPDNRAWESLYRDLD